MLRFLLFRVLQAIPVLFVMSVVTFAIIQAPPGDFGDFIKRQMISQGGRLRGGGPRRPRRTYRERHGLNDPLAVQYVRWITGIVTRGDFGYSYFYNKPVADVVAERLPRTIMLALICHFLASLLGHRLRHPGRHRQYSWIDTALSFVAFLGHDDPALPACAHHPLRAGLQLNVQELGSFYSSRYGGQPYWLGPLRLQLGQALEPDPARLAGGLHRDAGRPRLQHARDAGEPARHAQRAVRRDGPRQGPDRGRVIMRHAVPNALHPLVAYQGVVMPYMLTGEIEVAIVFSLATVGPAIVGSMGIGDVYVTATLLLVLGATLIVGNILADLASRCSIPASAWGHGMTDTIDPRLPPRRAGGDDPAAPRDPRVRSARLGARQRRPGGARRRSAGEEAWTPAPPPSRPGARATARWSGDGCGGRSPGMLGSCW
jgi:peptide/nickel transport system permease protein